MVGEAEREAAGTGEWSAGPWQATVALLKEEEGVDAVADTVEAVGRNDCRLVSKSTSSDFKPGGATHTLSDPRWQYLRARPDDHAWLHRREPTSHLDLY